MSVKIVTDSASDISPEIARELDITVIPFSISFGKINYRDGIDITPDTFYQKLTSSPDFPMISSPTPRELADIYSKLASETDEILSIHVSSKYGPIYGVAIQAKELVTDNCQIEVVDSKSIMMGQGLIVLEAAKASQSGDNIEKILSLTKKLSLRVHVRVVLDTLEYLRRAGNIGKAKVFLRTLLKINHIVEIREGEIYPITRERNRKKALEKLYNFVTEFKNIKNLAVEYTTAPEEAAELARQLNFTFAKESIRISKIRPTVGAQLGPNVMGVIVIEHSG